MLQTRVFETKNLVLSVFDLQLLRGRHLMPVVEICDRDIQPRQIVKDVRHLAVIYKPSRSELVSHLIGGQLIAQYKDFRIRHRNIPFDDFVELWLCNRVVFECVGRQALLLQIVVVEKHSFVQSL